MVPRLCHGTENTFMGKEYIGVRGKEFPASGTKTLQKGHNLLGKDSVKSR